MRDKKGFTLIELLIVVVIIGILAAIAIPKFSATREKAYFAAMKSDLKNLASQQEIYYADYYTYTSNTTNLGFVDSEGVTVTIAHHALITTCAGREPVEFLCVPWRGNHKRTHAPDKTGQRPLPPSAPRFLP